MRGIGAGGAGTGGLCRVQNPDEKRETEVIFPPAEIVRSIGSGPGDREDPGWN